MTGQKLLGVPIIVQHTQAEKNRVGNTLPNLAPKTSNGPTRLYVGSLHFNITEDMLRGIFEPFGKIDHIQLMTDPETGKSKGYGFLTVIINNNKIRNNYIVHLRLQNSNTTNNVGLITVKLRKKLFDNYNLGIF